MPGLSGMIKAKTSQTNKTKDQLCYNTGNKMKVTIKRWHQVVAWYWDVPNDDLCGICRGSFESTCSNCKFPGDDCPLVFGHCKHAFHVHCLTAWLSQDVARGLCPMCRQVFKSTDKGVALDTSAFQDIHASSLNEVQTWE